MRSGIKMRHLSRLEVLVLKGTKYLEYEICYYTLQGTHLNKLRP